MAEQLGAGVPASSLGTVFGLTQDEINAIDVATDKEAEIEKVMAKVISKAKEYITNNNLEIKVISRTVETTTGETKNELVLEITGLRDVKDPEVAIIQNIAKEIAASAASIRPTTPGVTMRVIKNDPIVAFVVSKTLYQTTTQVTYTVENEVTKEQLETLSMPLIIPTAAAEKETTTTEKDKVTTDKVTIKEPTKAEDKTKEEKETTAQGGIDLLPILIVIILIVLVAYFVLGGKIGSDNPLFQSEKKELKPKHEEHKGPKRPFKKRKHK